MLETELLASFRRLALRCVIVSNVQVRGAIEYQRDFADLGIAHLVDAVVTHSTLASASRIRRFLRLPSARPVASQPLVS